MRYRKKNRKKPIKTIYIFLLFVIFLIMLSISYSLWSTTLVIDGTAQLKYIEPQLPVEISPKGTDENGNNRYTTNTSMAPALLGDVYKFVSDEYEGNTITTTIKHTRKLSSFLAFFTNLSPTFTIEIPNNTSKDFSNGKIELIDSKDTNNILSKLNYKLSSDAISAGETAKVTVTGTLATSKDVATNTYYKFAISYKINEAEYYFYYTLVILPLN